MNTTSVNQSYSLYQQKTDMIYQLPGSCHQIFRDLGKWEMNDNIEAVKWLKTKPFIDGNKIGITGGSYGGYTTCMALTYGADYFNYGIANYSVTDWKLYDNVYTERYMDTPDQNPEG